MKDDNFRYWEDLCIRQKEVSDFKRETINRMLEHTDSRTLNLIYEIVIRLNSM